MYLHFAIMTTRCHLNSVNEKHGDQTNLDYTEKSNLRENFKYYLLNFQHFYVEEEWMDARLQMLSYSNHSKQLQSKKNKVTSCWRK